MAYVFGNHLYLENYVYDVLSLFIKYVLISVSSGDILKKIMYDNFEHIKIILRNRSDLDNY